MVVVDSEGKYEALKKYAINLTKMAKQGKLDLIIGCWRTPKLLNGLKCQCKLKNSERARELRHTP